jgi:DNA-binding protein HU-beta
MKGARDVRKQELVHAVAEATGQTEAAATRSVNAVFSAIEESLAKGDDVNISGFGSFRVVERAARKGRNPQSGDPITIEARRSPVFRAGTQLKRSVE